MLLGLGSQGGGDVGGRGWAEHKAQPWPHCSPTLPGAWADTHGMLGVQLRSLWISDKQKTNANYTA